MPSSNNPPPWIDITGISRAAMKDNAQCSIVDYNGNARPAELVVSQNTLDLYVGDNNGNLILLASPGGGDPVYYGEFIDTTTQTNTNVGRGIPARYNTIVISQGISVVNNSQIKMNVAGKYNIEFSFQFQKTDSGKDDVYVWLSKNGVDEPNTNTKISIEGNNAGYVAAWNFVVESIPSDYFEIMWGSADANMQITYTATPPIGPAIPSTIITVTQ